MAVPHRSRADAAPAALASINASNLRRPGQSRSASRTGGSPIDHPRRSATSARAPRSSVVGAWIRCRRSTGAQGSDFNRGHRSTSATIVVRLHRRTVRQALGGWWSACARSRARASTADMSARVRVCPSGGRSGRLCPPITFPIRGLGAFNCWHASCNL